MPKKPSNPAPEGQLFSATPYEQAPTAPKPPGWGVAHGRPEPSRPAEPQPVQPQLTPFKKPGPQFAERGVGKYYNPRNLSGQQFNGPAIRKSATNILDAYMESRYYRHAGLAMAMRGALGAPIPSHVNDWIQARHASETGTHSAVRTRGLNPGVFGARHRYEDEDDEYAD